MILSQYQERNILIQLSLKAEHFKILLKLQGHSQYNQTTADI
jgi:hypothetical protein